jgi:hypothetical protein
MENKFEYEIKPMAHRLDIDPKMTEAEAAALMLEFLALSSDAFPVMLSQCLLYVMRHGYHAIGRTPFVIVFVHTTTGKKKTTSAAFLTQIYNRADGIAKPKRLNGSIAGAEALLFEMSDCVIVLDDLFPSKFRNIISKLEQLLVEITRIIGDGVSRQVMNNKNAGKTPTSGAMFTGEYVIGEGSTAARLLPTELWPHPDPVALKAFQKKQLFVGNFYYHFISWYVANYEKIKVKLEEWWDVYVEMPVTEHPRLNETHYFLSSAYAMLMQYYYDRNFLNEEDVQTYHASFNETLSLLVQMQEERVDDGKQPEQTATSQYKKCIGLECLRNIKSIYTKDGFELASSPKAFSDVAHDGLIHADCLCLRGVKLEVKLREAGIDADIEEIGAALEAQGVLVRASGKRQKQIAGLSGKRFYFIRLDKL